MHRTTVATIVTVCPLQAMERPRSRLKWGYPVCQSVLLAHELSFASTLFLRICGIVLSICYARNVTPSAELRQGMFRQERSMHRTWMQTSKGAFTCFCSLNAFHIIWTAWGLGMEGFFFDKWAILGANAANGLHSGFWTRV